MLRTACCAALVTWAFRDEEKAKAEYVVTKSKNDALRCLVCLQRIYPEFSSLDTSNYGHLLTYFEKIWFSQVNVPSSRRHSIIWTFMSDLAGSQREEVHALLLNSLEKLHQTFLSFNGDEPLEKALLVEDYVMKTTLKLLAIVEKAFADAEGSRSQLNVQ
ncbi:hypothetical protein C0995_010255 [Termitomyces sp. Mi166|nr:hypothetical protein C0995_010255 [Termitomyces sp. Mi166\